MRKYIIIAALLTLLPLQARSEESMEELTGRVFSLAEKQYLMLDTAVGDGKMPRTVDGNGTLVSSDIRWWCSGFFPGSLWYIYEYSGDESVRAAAEKRTKALKPLLEMKTDHDIGFMIGCSYGNALRITGDTAAYRAVVLKAADKLAERFNPMVGAIRSWDGEWTKKWDYPVIIDNMMNLGLLMDAYDINGKENLKDVAVRHAVTTMNNHFRTDYSCWHLVNYNSADGSVINKQTHQGHSDGSLWARGQAWALYGYIMMYRKTGNEQFYMRADYIARLLLRILPEDGIPWWDFDCPDTYKDASAAAIMASAFIQMYEVSGFRPFMDMACRQIRTLAGPEYLATDGTNGGFLLKHSVGNLPGKSEIDAPLSYADYYFLEALMRYRKATGHPRLYLDERQFAALKGQIEKGCNPALSKMHDFIMKEAGELPSDPIEWVLDQSGKRILGKSRAALRRIMNDAYAYRFTGESKYLDHASRTIDEICSMPDWNGWHFLDIAEMSAAAGLAYDWLYHDLTPSRREMLERTIRDYALLEAFDFSKAWFYDRHHNWNQVCNGGLTIAALATREVNGVICGNIIRNAVKSSHNAISQIYAPDGCYAEGPVYWTYGNGYQVLLNDGLRSATGDGFGLDRIKGFDKAGDFVVSCYGSAHKLFSYSDNGPNERPASPVWYFAWRFGKPYLAVKEIEFLEKGNYHDGNCNVLPVLAAYVSRIDTQNIEVPSSTMYSGNGANPIVCFMGDRSGGESDWYLGIKGGRASNNHGHADAGSFVFDRDGVRWAMDPGGVLYTDAENELRAKGGDLWKMTQESLRWTIFPLSNEWHNTITVNGHLHNVDGKATISGEFCGADGAGATVDMGSVLSKDLKSATRTFYLDSGRDLHITDRLKAGSNSSATFTLVTEAVAEITADGVTLSLDGRKAFLSAKGANVSYRIVDSPEAASKGYTVLKADYKVSAGRESEVTFSITKTSSGE